MKKRLLLISICVFLGCNALAFAQPKTLVRKIKATEKPRAAQIENLLLARVQAQAEYDTSLIKGGTKQKQPLKEAISAGMKNAYKPGAVSWKDIKPILDRWVADSIAKVRFYEIYQTIVTQLRIKSPDIDSFSRDTLSPGGAAIVIAGVNFGPSQGKVLLEVRDGEVIELVVDNWTETSVTARVDRIIGEVPLRPHYRQLWLTTGDGLASNSFPFMYYPIYSEYWLTYSKSIGSCCCGDTADGPALRGGYIGDPDFSLHDVTRNHYGDGHSELKQPMASGQSLEQGYHIGCRGNCDASMTVFFQAWGPKGFFPPSQDDDNTSAWTYMDYDYPPDVHP